MNDIEYFKPDNCTRLDSEYYQPWAEFEVCSFLEKRCGLSLATPVKGRIVKHHDGAFDFWRGLVNSHKLEIPFDVLHVDAHNDLGGGDDAYCYLMSNLLHVNPEDRVNVVDRTKIEFGNYLAFAVACRWIARIHWICHPNKSGGLLRYHFKNCDPKSGVIELKKVDREFDYLSKSLSKNNILSVEPEIPFLILPWVDFVATESFDYFVLSESPGYTPLESDKLIPIIARYMEII